MTDELPGSECGEEMPVDWSLCQQALLLSFASLTGLGVLASSFLPELAARVQLPAGFLGSLGLALGQFFRNVTCQERHLVFSRRDVGRCSMGAGFCPAAVLGGRRDFRTGNHDFEHQW